VEPFPRISFDPAVMGGKPCIKGTRVTVSTMLGLMADGMSIPEILKDYPYITEEDLREVLRFAAWHAREMDLPFRAAS